MLTVRYCFYSASLSLIAHSFASSSTNLLHRACPKRSGQRHNSCNAIGSYGGFNLARTDTHASAQALVHTCVDHRPSGNTIHDWYWYGSTMFSLQCVGLVTTFLHYCRVFRGRACIACVRARGGDECGKCASTGVQIFLVPLELISIYSDDIYFQTHAGIRRH